jgi:hypothetical protein
MGTGKVLQLPAKLSGNRHRTLPFQKADNRGHRMLGRDLETHVDMVHQQMPLHNATFFLPRQLMKDPAQARTDFTVYCFPTILGHEHYMILALPA